VEYKHISKTETEQKLPTEYSFYSFRYISTLAENNTQCVAQLKRH